MSSQLCSITKWPALCVASWKGRRPQAASLLTFRALLNFPVLYVCVSSWCETSCSKRSSVRGSSSYSSSRMQRSNTCSIAWLDHMPPLQPLAHRSITKTCKSLWRFSRSVGLQPFTKPCLCFSWVGLFNDKYTEFGLETENAIGKMKAIFYIDTPIM